MEASSLPAESLAQLNRDLERITEDVENLSVQLTWMSYDMVSLRTSPEVGDSMQKLEEAYRRCRAAIFGETEHDPKKDS